MKKIFLLLFLLSAGFAHADNYFTLGENDYFRINPAYVSGEVTAMVRAHLDGRIDSWSLTMTYPNDLSPYRVTEQEDMTSIPYLNSNGTPCTHSATITTSNGFTVLSSTITEFGYWDFNNDGIYEPYGTIKWEAGDHDKMFKINFDVNGLCAGDSITITGTLSSTYDWRGGTTGVISTRGYTYVSATRRVTSMEMNLSISRMPRI